MNELGGVLGRGVGRGSREAPGMKVVLLNMRWLNCLQGQRTLFWGLTPPPLFHSTPPKFLVTHPSHRPTHPSLFALCELDFDQYGCHIPVDGRVSEGNGN